MSIEFSKRNKNQVPTTPLRREPYIQNGHKIRRDGKGDNRLSKK